ncbi:PAS domain S-box-containing protein/diguanylate cyclase (GGDEF) domain-containing protein [Sphaerotilus natans]|nr:sensor domain-containing diguanylate cyclase [Sphaerotilus natans]SIR56178.1 PAS domain S-box-containing protein/diguanylate cyclase (GGDEF) domain-containing protein [Sphaerotilus natans]
MMAASPPDENPGTDEQQELLQLLYAAPVGLVQTDDEGRIALVNAAAAQLLLPLAIGASLANLLDLLGPAMPDLALRARSGAPGELLIDGEALALRVGPEGRQRPLVLSLTLRRLQAGQLVAVLSDITAQVERERRLRQNEAWLNAALTGIHDHAAVGLDAEGRVAHWSASATQMTGFAREAVLGRPATIFHAGGATTPERLLDRLHEARADGWSMDEGWLVRADGQRYWGSTMIVPVSGIGDGDPPAGFSLVLRDISDRRDAHEQRRRASETDHLTGLANRRVFFEAGQREIERFRRAPRPLALLLLDADHFKRVNDQHGHAAGDEVLRQLAGVMLRSLRQVDVPARIGGEEFAVLLPSTGLEGARLVAERLRRAMAADTVTRADGTVIRYTVSIGLALMQADIAGLEALLERADRALYAAKAAGRDRLVVDGE